jgi:hypothetical protein
MCKEQLAKDSGGTRSISISNFLLYFDRGTGTNILLKFPNEGLSMSKCYPPLNLLVRQNVLKAVLLAGGSSMLGGSSLAFAVGNDDYPKIRKAVEAGRTLSAGKYSLNNAYVSGL